MFKFEMPVGWLGNGKIAIETNDFDVIEILKDFIEFQEAEGWVQCYEFSASDYEDEDEIEEDETLEETMSGQAVQ
jgi:hypothetical protein